jgi:hypothetical protein
MKHQNNEPAKGVIVTNLAITLILVLLLLSIVMAARADDQPPPTTGISTMTIDEAAKLADRLLYYGIWKERHDIETFPQDTPKPGETYDWATGNAIRSAVGEAVADPKPVKTEIIKPVAAEAKSEPVEKPDVDRERGRNHTCLTRQEARQRWPDSYLRWHGDHCWIKG